MHIWARAPPRCMPSAGKVISWEPCAAAADPVDHRRPEKAIMRDLAAGKFGGFQRGRSYWRSAAARHLCSAASVTALWVSTGGANARRSKAESGEKKRTENTRARPVKTAGEVLKV